MSPIAKAVGVNSGKGVPPEHANPISSCLGQLFIP